MKNFNKLFLFLLLASVVSLSSCAHKTKVLAEVDKKTPDKLQKSKIIQKNFSQDSYDSPYQKYIESAFEKEFRLRRKYFDRQHFVQFLEIGEEAFKARVHWIRKAKKFIYIQTYIWKNDPAGRFLMLELAKAAQRGVKVKILIDKFGAEDDPEWIAYLLSQSPNLEIRYYNSSTNSLRTSVPKTAVEFLFRFKKLNQRMHNKSFIVDDHTVITGGRNYSNKYYDLSNTLNFMDREILLIGPVVSSFTQVFLSFWESDLTELSLLFNDVLEEIYEKKYEQQRADLPKDWLKKDLANEKRQVEFDDFYFDPIFFEWTEEAQDFQHIKNIIGGKMFDVRDIEFTADKPGKTSDASMKGRSKTQTRFRRFLERAENEVIIQSPYLVLDRKISKTFKSLLEKNRQMEFIISTNSLANTDNLFVYGHMNNYIDKYVLDYHFKIYQLMPVPEDILEILPNYYYKMTMSPEDAYEEAQYYTEKPEEKFLCVHAKSFVIDEELSWIGSFNLDSRSLYLNTELGVIIRDNAFAKELKKNILQATKPQNSWVMARENEHNLKTHFSKFTHAFLKYISFVPSSLSTSVSLYELKEGGKVLDPEHPDFYENYNDVGLFPQVPLSAKRIHLLFFKSLIHFAEPLL